MKPIILIENEVYRKVMHWVNKSDDEVSGLGTVRVEEGGVLRVISTMLLPQKNGNTHTDIEPEDVNKALFDLRHAEGDLRWWWHSHVNMSVFWSGTDMDTIKKIGAGGWFANTVFNKKNEVRSSWYGAHAQTTPWGTSPLFLDELQTKMVEVTPQEATLWDTEYDENVTKRRKTHYPVTPHSSNWRDRWSSPEWEKDDSGYWRKKSTGESNSPTGTNTTSVIDLRTEPPKEQPAGMSKNAYKKWVRSWNKTCSRAGHAAVEQNKHLPAVVTPPALPFIDVYGFTQEERILLAQEGWTDQDIEVLMEENVTPNEMLVCARADMTPMEILHMINGEHWSVEDIAGYARGILDDDHYATWRGAVPI